MISRWNEELLHVKNIVQVKSSECKLLLDGHKERGHAEALLVYYLTFFPNSNRSPCYSYLRKTEGYFSKELCLVNMPGLSRHHDHKKNLEQVLQRLRNTGLKLSAQRSVTHHLPD